jgi:hypothetical protein
MKLETIDRLHPDRAQETIPNFTRLMHNQVANMLTPINTTPPPHPPLTPKEFSPACGEKGRAVAREFQTNPAKLLKTRTTPFAPFRQDEIS